MTYTSVNDSAWLTHEMVFAAIHEPNHVEAAATLRDYATEAERVDATGLAKDLRRMADEREEAAASLRAAMMTAVTGMTPEEPTINPANVAPELRVAMTRAMTDASFSSLEVVTPGQLVVGDIVSAHGMVLLVTDMPERTNHPGGRTFVTRAIVLNREAVSADVIPFGWTRGDPKRGPAYRHESTDEHYWTLQGNDLAGVARLPR